MTDECIILSDNGIQKARSFHRVTPKEKFLIRELEKAREFLWNDLAENLKSAIETRQDQGSSGHRRYASDDRNRDEDWSNTWMQRLCRIEISHGSMSRRTLAEAK